MKLLGLHHVTAITGNAKENYAFYTKILGMRLIKKTINFGDPGVYHLYYSDAKGSVGSLLTFFGYEGAQKGNVGRGSGYKIQCTVPSLDLYKKNFEKHSYPYTFSDGIITLKDPDGLELELCEGKVDDIKITGVYAHSNHKTFYDFLTFKDYTLPDSFKFIMSDSNEKTIQGAGSIHHIALSVKDSLEQEKFRENLTKIGIRVSPVIERNYFKSIYFPDSNGMLLEIATFGPGMYIDEEIPGSELVLPPWYEKYRKEIESQLPLLK